MDIKLKVKELIAEGYVEGELQVDPLWYIIWEPEEIEQFNSEYQFSKYAPEFIGFGESGSNELLAVNDKGEVFTIPAIGMESQYAEKIASSIDELKQYMEKTI
ncbi:hypothetical protein [Reinekea blandensis]|uniref:Knr4/Smi1-like domain-containing protein n=1 Tax=Reinekea blandensis MED297 TaxID=314283 RepID=A4BGA4_9GAMM|nr:hypothetical protein [Reinekea blandensis]EAR08899.1 hypothetical protein MED297_04497 [Reinekea sp. MED297] [Reinekea blandensis MED297]